MANQIWFDVCENGRAQSRPFSLISPQQHFYPVSIPLYLTRHLMGDTVAFEGVIPDGALFSDDPESSILKERV